MKKTMLFFTYGTLMKGQVNSGMLDNAHFIERVTTKPQYTLMSILGNYPFPALLSNGDTAVSGELYEVPMDIVKVMDIIEGHPHNYCRKPVVLEKEFGRPVIAYFLVNNEWLDYAEVIPSGDWLKR